MKRFILVFACIAFLFPASVRAEEIREFHQDMTINADGTVSVTEKIGYDFRNLSRHGIYRTIPETKTNADGKKFILTLTDFSVTDEKGSAYHFSTSRTHGERTLKIGDADVTITGKKQYDILYSVGGALTYFSDHDELYWNVTGNGWEVPISAVKSQITLPARVNKDDLRLACFTGNAGSTAADCTVTFDPNSKTVQFQSTRSLDAYEGFTIVVGFPKGIVAVLEPKEYVPFWGSLWGKVIFVIIVIFVIFWYILLPLSLPYKWWKYGRDPKPAIGVASAWFEAPKTKSGRLLTPGETGTLVDERVDNADIVATIIDLARRGYLKILEPKKGDIHLEKTIAPPKNNLTPFEQLLYKGIFSTTDSVNIKTGSLIKPITDTKEALYTAVVSEGFFLKNPQSTRTKYTMLGILGLVTGNFPLVLSSFIFGIHIPAKTSYGAQLAAVARSLKNFITSQDRQFKFQAEKQLLFEKMLPFAIAFGVEKLWIARFASMHLKNPDWYSGYSSGRFNAIAFVSTLNSTTSSVARAATPTSSSSGFSSGFSGGSSGGGGGGGGGGSW